MNEAKTINDFKKNIERLLEDIERAVAADGIDPYSGSGEGNILEHTTREFLIDGIMEALGWTLGAVGNMAEEARVKAETTTFMDYVGVTPHMRAPVLIVEAKAWDKPFISHRRLGENRTDTDEELIIQAIEHWKSGGTFNDSPVTKTWHEYVEQIGGYVRNLKDQHDHNVKRVLLTSGQWMLIFVSPTNTFLDDVSIDERQFVIFRKDEYVAKSTEILDLLGRTALVGDLPSTLRPAQLPDYIKPTHISGAFNSLHVRYEESGSSRFVMRPRILVYEAIHIRRFDGALLTVMEESDGSNLEHDNGTDILDSHLNDVATKSATLRTACTSELGTSIPTSPLSSFSGFPVKPRRANVAVIEPIVVEDQDVANEWMLATGSATHFLFAQPVIGECRFHTWSACRDVGFATGKSALSTRSTGNPRAFFTDSQPHHCAHQQVLDRRNRRCRIAALDERVCCQACIYLEICWTAAERGTLPCGQ